MPSSAESAKARKRRRQYGLSSLTFTLVFGSLLYLIAACFTISVNSQRRAGLLRQADLAIAPTDCIAVVAALLAVVLSINLALAVMARPDDPVEQVLSTDWQLAMGMVCALCAGFSVMTVLMCWFSSQRSHSWGALIGATALAWIAVALTALIWTRTRAYGYAKAEIFRLRRRRDRLLRAMECFQLLHPHRRRGMLAAILLSQLPVLVLALTSTALCCMVALADHRSTRMIDVARLLLFAAGFQALLLPTACLCWLLPYAEGPLDRIGSTIWLAPVVVVEIALVFGILITTPLTALLPIATYCGYLVGAPIVLLVADRRLGRFGWLTCGLRALAGVQLAGRIRQTRRELKAARKMRRRLRPKPIEQRNELQAVSG